MDAASVFLELLALLFREGAGEEMRSVDAEVRSLGAIVELFFLLAFEARKDAGEAIG